MITIEFVPQAELAKLSSLGKIRKLLKLAKEDKIVMLEGRLKPEEEAELIKINMEEIDDEFKGIEFAVINPEEEEKLNFMKKFRLNLVNVLLRYRPGFTIVGPASVVKEIKKDPHKIELFMKEEEKRKSGKKSKKKKSRK